MGASGVHAFSDDDGAEFLDELVEEGAEYCLTVLKSAAEVPDDEELDFKLGAFGMAAAEVFAVSRLALAHNREASINYEVYVFEQQTVVDLLPYLRELPAAEQFAERAVKRIRTLPSVLAELWFEEASNRSQWLAYTDDLLARIKMGTPA